jgi:hypothetical protein
MTPLMGKYVLIGSSAAMRAWVAMRVANGFCQHCSKDLDKSDHSPACGVCSSCRWFLEGHHPDYLSLSSEEPGGRISIEQVRSAIHFLSQTPQQAVCRVIVIWDADCLTVSAANAFLKTLEEPASESVLIILATAHPSLLLDTIRSRCFQVRLPPSTEAQKHTAIWMKEDEQLLRACQEAWEVPARLCNIVELLSKSMGLREVLYSLLKMGYIMANVSIKEELVCCEGLSSGGQQFLAQVSAQMGVNLWKWIDRIYENIQGIQQGISLNAVLLLESLFITRCLLGKQGRQILDGSSIVSYN